MTLTHSHPFATAGADRLNHYKYIDALRGFAFLAVFTVHASQYVPQQTPFQTLPAGGAFGVQLFFLLSAVTLLRSLALRSRRETFPLRNFFIRRFFRIAPLFYCGLVFYGLARSPRADAVAGWEYASTLLFLHGWTPRSINHVVPGGWSIAVEMTFYLCLPFLARWITTARQALWAAFGALLFATLLNLLLMPSLVRDSPSDQQALIVQFFTFWFPAQLPVFLLGFAVYYWLHDPAVTGRLAAQPRRVWLVVLAVLGLDLFARLDAIRFFPSQVCAAAVFVVGIMSLAARPSKLAVNTWTCGLGTVSFGAYLSHFAVLGVVARLLPVRFFGFLPGPLASLGDLLVVWCVALPCTAAVSALLHRWIEKPGINLGNWIISRYELSAARGSDASPPMFSPTR